MRGGDFASRLQDEVMTELAGDFFAARKAIDTEVALFRARVADIDLAGQRVQCTAALLFALLPGADGAPALLSALEVPDAERFSALCRGVQACLHVSVPWAFTRAGRYAGTVHAAYSRLWTAVDRYTNGMGYRAVVRMPHMEAAYGSGHSGATPLASRIPEQESGYAAGHATARTMGWKRYLRWCDELNERITAVNRNHAPSLVLGLARSMDVETAAKERASGGGVDGLDASMDTALRLPPMECGMAGVGPLPDLPEPDAVRHAIRGFAKQYYARHRSAAESAMRCLSEESCVLSVAD